MSGSLVPRPLQDFHSQPWRQIGRRPGTNTMSRTGNVGLDLIMMTTCPRNMRTVKFVYGLCEYQIAKGVMRVRGQARRSVSGLLLSKTEKMARLLAGMYKLSPWLWASLIPYIQAVNGTRSNLQTNCNPFKFLPNHSPANIQWRFSWSHNIKSPKIWTHTCVRISTVYCYGLTGIRSKPKSTVLRCARTCNIVEGCMIKS